jgi:hypothetical protein
MVKVTRLRLVALFVFIAIVAVMSGTKLGRSADAQDAKKRAALAPNVSSSMTAALAPGGDATGNGVVNPGDTVRYTVTIDNAQGATDALNTVFTDTLDPNLTLVPGSLKVAPLAADDPMNVYGNVGISTADGALNLLANDISPMTGNNTNLTVTAATVSSSLCAGCNNVTLNANGTFTYDPPVGITGADSFVYTVTDTTNGLSSIGTAKLTISGMIWFINNNAAVCTVLGNQCGKLSKPFSTIDAFRNANTGGAGEPSANQDIFIYESGAGYAASGTITLLAGQRFVGSDTAPDATPINNASILNLTMPAGSATLPSTSVFFNDARITGFGFTLATNNTLRGFTQTNAPGNTKLLASNFGTLTLGDLTFTGTGKALDLTNGTLALAPSGVSFSTLSSQSSVTQGLSLTTVAGTLTAGGTIIANSTTESILVSNSTANISFGNTQITNGGTDGVSFQNNTAGTRTFGDLNVSGGTGSAFRHTAAGGNVTVTGTTSLTTPGSAISVDSNTSAITFAGTTATTTGAGNAGVVSNASSGALSFTSLAITTNAGVGLSASGGGAGSITVTNPGGSNINGAATQPAAAIVVSNTALNANFTTVNCSGGANCVSLINVTGTSALGGGALTGASGATFFVDRGTVSTTYSGNITQANNAPLLSVGGQTFQHTGTLTFTGTLSATNGTGLQFDNADGTYNFNGTTTLNGGDAGVDIFGAPSPSGGTFNFGANTSITNPTGTAFRANGLPAVTYSGNITKSGTSPGLLVDLTNITSGTILFQTGTLSSTSSAGTGIQLSNADGTVSFNGTTTLNGGDAGVDIVNGTDNVGAITFASGTTITNPSGTAFNFNGSSKNVNFNGNISKASAGLLVDITDQGATGITFANGTLSATAGTGINLNNVDGTVDFNGTTTLNGGDAGVDITTGSGGNINFAGGTSITNPTGIAFNESTGTAGVSFGGTISQTNAASAVKIANKTGGSTTFLRTGGAGGQITASTGAASAIDLDTIGGTINFNSGMAITTTAGIGFRANGVASISATQDNTTIINTISSTTGTALSAVNSTIGGANLTFRSISAGTAAGSAGNGVVIDTTGSSGGLKIVGNGTPASGGTIQHKTGADSSTTAGIGIYLNSTSNVVLDRMQLNNFDNYAIRGLNVNGFSLANSVVDAGAATNTNGTSAGLDEGSISFGTAPPTAVNGITGTVSITNSTIADGFVNNVAVYNSSGTLNLTVDNCIVRDTGGGSAGAGNDGILVKAFGTATNNVDVKNSQFIANRGDHFNATGDLGGNLNVQFGNNGANTLTGGSVAPLGQSIVVQTGVGWNPAVPGSAKISNNTITGAVDTPINVNIGGTGTFNATVNNNTIGANGVAGSGTVNNEDAIRIVANGDKATDATPDGGTLTAAVTNNTIQQVAGRGIYCIGRDGGTAADPIQINLTVRGNLLRQSISATGQGIFVESGASSTPIADHVTILADIGGAGALANSLTDDWGSVNVDGIDYDEIRLRHAITGGNQFQLTGYAGGGTDTAAVGAYLAGRNTLPPGGVGVASASLGGGNSYANGGPPPQPPIPPSALGEMASATFDGSPAASEKASAEAEMRPTDVETAAALGAMASAETEMRLADVEKVLADVEKAPAFGAMASAEVAIRPATAAPTTPSTEAVATPPQAGGEPSAFEIVAEIAKRAASEVSPTVYSQEVRSPAPRGYSGTDKLASKADDLNSAPELVDTVIVNGGGSGFTLPPGKSVTITFDATVAPVGTIPANTFSISNQGSTSGTGFGPILTDGDLVTAGIQPTVVTIVQPETIAKAFNPTTVTLGTQSTLTFTITNANPATAATGVTFTDVFPTTPGPMTVASPVTASTTCAGGTLTNNTGGILTPGDPGIKLAGGTLAANGATCTVSVKVATNLAGTYNNTSGNVASIEGASGLTASASLTASPLTASGVSVSGRVIQGEGRGIRNARVVITDAAGVSRTVMTGPRGNFRFEDVMAGETYTISVAARRFTFTPRVITVVDELTDVDFIAEPYQ